MKLTNSPSVQTSSNYILLYRASEVKVESLCAFFLLCASSFCAGNLISIRISNILPLAAQEQLDEDKTRQGSAIGHHV